MTSSTASPSKPSASLTSSAKKWAIDRQKARALVQARREEVHVSGDHLRKRPRTKAKNVNPDAPLDWVRVEFRIHPTKESKVTASKLQPEQIARSGRWTDYLCDLLGATSVLGSSSTPGTKSPGASSPLKTCTASTSASSPKRSRISIAQGGAFRRLEKDPQRRGIHMLRA